jgi:hypothetical protein
MSEELTAEVKSLLKDAAAKLTGPDKRNFMAKERSVYSTGVPARPKLIWDGIVGVSKLDCTNCTRASSVWITRACRITTFG